MLLSFRSHAALVRGPGRGGGAPSRSWSAGSLRLDHTHRGLRVAGCCAAQVHSGWRLAPLVVAPIPLELELSSRDAAGVE